MRLRLILSLVIPVLLLANEALAAGYVQPGPRLLESAFYEASGSASITLGSPLEEVRNVFGILPDEQDGDCFCMNDAGETIDGTAKTLRYSGLEVVLERRDGSPDYETTRIVVTGPNRWMTPGLVVGMTKADVKTLLGKPDTVGRDWESGNKNVHYFFDSGRSALTVTTAKGRVIRIEMHTRECKRSAD